MRRGALLLALLLWTLGLQSALAEEWIAVAPRAVTGGRNAVQEGTSLTVAAWPAAGGQFGMDVGGGNATDLNIRALLHGYDTVAMTRDRGLAVHEVAVTALEGEALPDGGRVYTFTIADGLAYSDGTPLTAADYVFSVLLQSAPAFSAIGMPEGRYAHVTGYEAFHGGESSIFSGVRLLSPQRFSLSLRAEALPDFYGMDMLRVTPYPIGWIAPGCAVHDDGVGAYLQGDLSVTLLRETLLHPGTGYVAAPQVVSGPYAFSRHDRESGEVTLAANRLYRGNYEGQGPAIERIIVRDATALDGPIALLAAGEVDLLVHVTDGRSIQAGQEAALQSENIRYSAYPRSGLAYLAFACAQPPVETAVVRRAVALCVDADALLQTQAVGHARRVHGYYGPGQWMVSAAGVGDALEALACPFDIEAAIALLAAEGWIYDAQGNAYVAHAGAVRHRLRGGMLEPLTIHWAKAEQSAVANEIEALLREALPQAGIGLEVTEMPFAQVLEAYMAQAEHPYTMYFLANDFQHLFDPVEDMRLVGVGGNTLLMERAIAMRRVSPSSRDAYVESWVAFQRAFAEEMPMVPLYANVYFDFYTDRLQGYQPSEGAGWAQALLYAYLAP